MKTDSGLNPVAPQIAPQIAPQTQVQSQGQPGQSNPLTELRGLHEPEPISTWPPAPGWWLLSVVLVAGFILLTLKAFKYNRKRAYRRQAIRELMLAREHYRSSGDGSAYAQELLELLKRTALTAYPRDKQRIAGLHGEEWLRFLDSTCASCTFRSPEGLGLLRAAYSSEADASALHECYTQAGLWIAAHQTYGGQLRA